MYNIKYHLAVSQATKEKPIRFITNSIKVKQSSYHVMPRTVRRQAILVEPHKHPCLALPCNFRLMYKSFRKSRKPMGAYTQNDDHTISPARPEVVQKLRNHRFRREAIIQRFRSRVILPWKATDINGKCIHR